MCNPAHSVTFNMSPEKFYSFFHLFETVPDDNTDIFMPVSRLSQRFNYYSYMKINLYVVSNLQNNFYRFLNLILDL